MKKKHRLSGVFRGSRRLLCVLLSVLLALPLLPGDFRAHAVDEPVAMSAYGSNSSATSFSVSSKDELIEFSTLVSDGNNFSGKTVTLTADIVLNDTTGWESWETTPPTNTWTPIGIYENGNDNRAFQGTFDGGGHTVSGIYINTDADYQGLFGYTVSATVKNVHVVASWIRGGSCVGGICGYSAGRTIQNCSNAGKVSGSSDWVGGICGENLGGTIEACCNTVLSALRMLIIESAVCAGLVPTV